MANGDSRAAVLYIGAEKPLVSVLGTLASPRGLHEEKDLFATLCFSFATGLPKGGA